ncbi:hypothetical protein CQA49_03310 [Helicobacter sp. MIT 00-7814]|uniref:hypothetical protein n=1 Tax=unclassified Helicobacter TaxID=2593540 RepID=UPI000E1E79A4|nr:MULTISPECIES: hypothetical protein [unclassified Helicobacter]RDU55504.1 hypothetical protein CQA37_03730 [Helicobacter sp. MIT 99-10781]RDU55594.1 hypothetical protein CQA49_03310 [Helicobacter sp. MIT 00-7814]
MFNIYFYALCWLAMLIFALPIIFAGLLSVALESEPQKAVENPLQELAKNISANKENKEQLKVNYDTFRKKFSKAPPVGSADYQTWLNIIYDFSINPLLMEAEEVAKFRDELEDSNASIKNDIRTKIGTALQKREKK